jgi:methyl-accepting chemotaxis protein
MNEVALKIDGCSTPSGAAKPRGGKENINRLTSAFALTVMLFLLMTGVGLWTLTDVAALVGNKVNGGAKDERLLRDWLGETKANAVRAMVLARTGDEAMVTLLTPALQAASQKISALEQRVGSTLLSAESRALFAAVGENRQHYIVARTAAMESRKAGNHDEATRIVDARVTPAITAYLASIQTLVDHEAAYVDASGQNAVASAQSGRMLFGIVAVVILCFSAIILFWIVTAITRPLLKSLKIVESISGGDLSRTIRASSTGEARRLMMALETMRNTLSHQVGAIRNAADSVRGASHEIEQGNRDLSRRTEVQAAALEQTAVSLVTLTTAVKRNADNAREADRLAADASAVALRGGKAMYGVVRTIADISTSSRRIADIIGVIDQIAFQTNILSLNAAVEAARAGEQGKGFAVVASEVRLLAQRSAQAAKEIKTLIADSADRVAAGVREVEGAEKSIDDIVASVNHLSAINASIAAASSEQLKGLQHIGSAVTDLDSTTRQNAALVEQTSAAAAHMTDQVNEMASLVTHFVLEQRAVQSVTQATPPSAGASREHGKSQVFAPLTNGRLTNVRLRTAPVAG